MFHTNCASVTFALGLTGSVYHGSAYEKVDLVCNRRLFRQIVCVLASLGISGPFVRSSVLVPPLTSIRPIGRSSKHSLVRPSVRPFILSYSLVHPSVRLLVRLSVRSIRSSALEFRLEADIMVSQHNFGVIRNASSSIRHNQVDGRLV